MGININISGNVQHLYVNGYEARKVFCNGVEVPFGGTPTEYHFTLTSWLLVGVYGTQSSPYAVTVDWGDNSAVEGSAALNVELDHTYAAPGSYVVTVRVQPGETFTVGSESYISLDFITSAVIGDGITMIEAQAFASSSITEVICADDLTEISLSAFAGCTDLATVELGSGIAELRNSAFNACSSLRSITIHASTPPHCGRYVLTGVPADCAIYVPSASVAAYQAASEWSDRAAYIQAIP